MIKNIQILVLSILIIIFTFLLFNNDKIDIQSFALNLNDIKGEEVVLEYKKNQYNGQFKDVKEGKWYYSDLKTCYEWGLINGQSKKVFGVNENINLAEVLAIACRIHSFYNYKKIDFEIEEGLYWYRDVGRYAIENNIITKEEANTYGISIYDEVQYKVHDATREQVANIFSRILPDKEYEEINKIDEIVDVESENIYKGAILKLYRAGILAGNNKYGAFEGGTKLTRKEVCSIAVRVINKDNRVKLKLKKSNKPKEVKKINTNGVPVLMYHQIVSDKEKQGNDNDLIVNCSEFDRQLQLLKEEGYVTVTLDELLSYIKGEKNLPEKSVVITFDDGYKGNAKYAAPLLQKYGYNATVFTNTVWLDTEHEPYLFGQNTGPYQRISYEDIEMTKPILDYQAHTETHKRLTALSYKEATEEIKKSLDKINGSYLAYPYGSYNEDVISIAQSLGVKAAFTIEPNHCKVGENVYKIPRYNIYHNTKDKYFLKIIKGK